MSDVDQYSRYFVEGAKVGVGIPLPNAEIFRDWAIIHEIDEDLVTLQLSRDILPEHVILSYGQILEVRSGKEGAGYSCRAIIVSEGDSNELLLRLIGEVVSDELREFYRIDAFLPIKYYIPSDQNIDHLHKQWSERCERRHLEDMDRRQKTWDSTYMSGKAELPKEPHPKSVEEDAHEEFDSYWDTIIPLAANISGGGLRLLTHQGFDNGDYVLLEIMVPYPRRIIDVIARIVFANRNLAMGSDHEYFVTGMQFVYINERDRDAVVNHISNVQLKRIKQLREKYLFRSGEAGSGDENDSTSQVSVHQLLLNMGYILIVALVMAGLAVYFWKYATNHPKGEIEQIFEEGLKRYLDKLK